MLNWNIFDYFILRFSIHLQVMEMLFSYSLLSLKANRDFTLRNSGTTFYFVRLLMLSFHIFTLLQLIQWNIQMSLHNAQQISNPDYNCEPLQLFAVKRKAQCVSFSQLNQFVDDLRPEKWFIGPAPLQSNPNICVDIQLLQVSPCCIKLCTCLNWNRHTHTPNAHYV